MEAFVVLLAILAAVVINFMRKEKQSSARNAKPAYHCWGDTQVQEFLSAHPEEKAIVDLVRSCKIALYGGKIGRRDYGAEIGKIFDYGTLMVMEVMDRLSGAAETTSCVILTPNMAYLHRAKPEQDMFYFSPNIHAFLGELELRPVKVRVTSTKKSSVVGSAIVGGVIAGGAGAVVGATAAASNNATGKTAAGEWKDSKYEKELTVKSLTDWTGSVKHIHTVKGSNVYHFPYTGNSRTDRDCYKNFNTASLDSLCGSDVERVECFLEYLKNVCEELDAK